MPSFVAPSRTCISISWRGEEAVWLSTRLKMILEGFLGFPGHKGGVYLADRCLLGTKAAADAGLGNTHHGFGDVQGIGDVAPCMEHDLGGAEHVQPPISVNGTIGAEGFHHGLLAGLGVVNMVDHHIAPRQHCVDVSGAALIVGTQVALVVGSLPGTGPPSCPPGAPEPGCPWRCGSPAPVPAPHSPP